MDLDVRHWLLLLLLCSGAWITGRLLPPHTAHRIHVTLTKQNGSITELEQPRTPAYTQSFFVDTLHFPPGQTLTHPSLGDLGVTSDFFLDLSANFVVLIEGDYEFSVSSDDGYRLSIDGHSAMAFLSTRAFATDTAPVHLRPGTHTLTISYFQGFGPLGLSAQYRRLPEKLFRYVGQDSAGISFTEQH